jgi:hypothetical protein
VEYVTRFYVRAPEFLGLVAWPSEFFVIFNLVWIALWLVAAVGMKRGIRAAFFPVWFFAVGLVGNALWHPLLSLATGGYFPGLFTSPFAGIIGVLLLSRLWRLTKPAAAPIARRSPGKKNNVDRSPRRFVGSAWLASSSGRHFPKLSRSPTISPDQCRPFETSRRRQYSFEETQSHDHLAINFVCSHSLRGFELCWRDLRHDQRKREARWKRHTDYDHTQHG